jgi:hypothetical protein
VGHAIYICICIYIHIHRVHVPLSSGQHVALDLFGQQLPVEAQREGAGDACGSSGLGVARVAPVAGGVAPVAGGAQAGRGAQRNSSASSVACSPNKRVIFVVMAGIASDSRFPPVQDLLRSATRQGLLLLSLY